MVFQFLHQVALSVLYISTFQLLCVNMFVFGRSIFTLNDCYVLKRTKIKCTSFSIIEAEAVTDILLALCY